MKFSISSLEYPGPIACNKESQIITILMTVMMISMMMNESSDNVNNNNQDDYAMK
jgi:hypothetical protein